MNRAVFYGRRSAAGNDQAYVLHIAPRCAHARPHVYRPFPKCLAILSGISVGEGQVTCCSWLVVAEKTAS